MAYPLRVGSWDRESARVRERGFEREGRTRRAAGRRRVRRGSIVAVFDELEVSWGLVGSREGAGSAPKHSSQPIDFGSFSETLERKPLENETAQVSSGGG